MASVVFDRRRGAYLIQWFDGRKWTRDRVHRISRWKPGGARPARDPMEVTRALAHYQDRERRARHLAGHRDPDQTIADFLAAHEMVHGLSRAAGSTGQLKQATRNFLRWCEEVGLHKLDEVTPARCREWLASRAMETSQKTGRPITRGTLKKEAAYLSAAWTAAVKVERLDRNPWLAVEVPGRDQKPERGSWSPEEYRRVMDAARPWLRDIVAVACHSGLRISALLGLEWRDIRWNDGDGPGFGSIVVRAEMDKAGKGYTVPMHEVAHDVLARRRAHQDGDRVLTGQAGRPSRGGITREAIHIACRHAGLPAPASANHHMRRTFGRWAILGHLTGRPVPLYVVSRWLGHASTKMTEVYLDVRPDESADWMSGGEDSSGP